MCWIASIIRDYLTLQKNLARKNMSCPLFELREKSSLPEIITSRLPKRVYQGVRSPPETESACLESVRWTPDPYFRYFSKSGIFKMAPKTAGWIQLKEKYSQNSARTQKSRTNYISNWSGNTTQQNIPASRCCKSFGNLFIAKIWRASEKSQPFTFTSKWLRISHIAERCGVMPLCCIRYSA